jgi:hypothetical protein
LPNLAFTSSFMRIFQVINKLFRFNRANWKAVVLCFFTAFIFWLFSALNKNHTTNINFPIQFEYDKSRYMPVLEPRHVSLNVSGNGWDLLRKSVGLRLPILMIPLDKPSEIRKIPGSTLLALVSGQLNSLQINYAVGDTLDLQIDLKDSHKFRLMADLNNITYKSGFGRISPVVILPDSVEIEGPKSILHDFPDTILLSLSENRLSENFREEAEVVVPNTELIKRNPPVVEVRFEVGQVEEITWNLKLQFLNKKAAAVIEAPDSVTCYLVVPKNHGRDILLQTQARAIVDLSGLPKGKSILMPATEGLSPMVQLVRIDSVHLELL